MKCFVDVGFLWECEPALSRLFQLSIQRYLVNTPTSSSNQSECWHAGHVYWNHHAFHEGKIWMAKGYVIYRVDIGQSVPFLEFRFQRTLESTIRMGRKDTINLFHSLYKFQGTVSHKKFIKRFLFMNSKSFYCNLYYLSFIGTHIPFWWPCPLCVLRTLV